MLFTEYYGTNNVWCLGGLTRCELDLNRYSHWPKFESQSSQINCVKIYRAHALTVISQTSKGIRHCSVLKFLVAIAMGAKTVFLNKTSSLTALWNWLFTGNRITWCHVSRGCSPRKEGSWRSDLLTFIATYFGKWAENWQLELKHCIMCQLFAILMYGSVTLLVTIVNWKCM